MCSSSRNDFQQVYAICQIHIQPGVGSFDYLRENHLSLQVVYGCCDWLLMIFFWQIQADVAGTGVRMDPEKCIVL